MLNGVSFDLTKKANREEIAVLSYNLIVSVLGKEPTGMDELKFSDKEKIAENYRKAVAYLTQKEVLKGYEDRSFDPDKPVVRGDVAAIIYRLLTVLSK